MKNLIFILCLLFLNSTLGFEGGHCPVGPFGTDGDTGPYTGRCQELSVAEICEFFLNGIDDGDITDVDPAKVRFCENML